jgi:hypothetical protein
VGTASLRDLLELIGEQGMVLVCVFLTLPFLLPVSKLATHTRAEHHCTVELSKACLAACCE